MSRKDREALYMHARAVGEASRPKSELALIDNQGVTINVGDTVHVSYIDRGRGAEMWMDKGTVIGFGRTRVIVQFPSRTKPMPVGAECLRVLP